MDPIRMLKDLTEALLYNRYPIKVSIVFQGIPEPHVTVEIQNRTPNSTVHIHTVGIHYGMKERNLAFVLFPSTKVSIGPKDKAVWRLDYTPERTIIRRNTIMNSPPPYPQDDTGPGIESPADLFNAIGMGKPKDSWIEVDFNEYEGRVFRRGYVKQIFDSVGKATRELRKKTSA